MDAAYVVVVALCRPLKPQMFYWIDFLKMHVDLEQSAVIVVGSKADLLEQKKELPAREKELCEIAREHNLQPPVILSSHDLINVSALKKTISKSSKKILRASSRDVPSSYLLTLETLRVSKDLVVKSKQFPDQVLQFFHNLGEIVFDRDSGNTSFRIVDFILNENLGLICSNPEILAKLMALFVCPDLHELSLLGFIEKLKRPRNAIRSSTVVKQQIQIFLSQFTKQYPTCTNDEVVNSIVLMMVGLKFMIPLTREEGESHGQSEESFLIPSLRPFGRFRWNFLKDKEKETTLTFGRRIKLRNSKYIHPNWLCFFQVRFYMNIL